MTKFRSRIKIFERTVEVLDKNDNQPIVQGFQLVVNNLIGTDGRRVEDFPTGIIGRVPAVDPDVNDTLSFSFSKPGVAELILIENGGAISLKPALSSNRPMHVAGL